MKVRDLTVLLMWVGYVGASIAGGLYLYVLLK